MNTILKIVKGIDRIGGACSGRYLRQDLKDAGAAAMLLAGIVWERGRGGAIRFAFQGLGVEGGYCTMEGPGKLVRAGMDHIQRERHYYHYWLYIHGLPEMLL